MRILGIIPARGGSKGILRKNLQTLGNNSLLGYAIQAAIDSHVLDRTIVSSDDSNIIKEASRYPGVEIPFKRPDYLATDKSSIGDVVSYLLEWLKQHEGYVPDAFMILQPTSPFRTTENIRNAVEYYQQQSNPCLVSVSSPIQYPGECVYDGGNSNWKYCFPCIDGASGRQDYKEAWFINGAIYITATNYFASTSRIFDIETSCFFKMPIESGLDIDTPFDLELARAYQKILMKI